MRYFGGKARIAPALAEFLQPFVGAASCYIEPFVGGANVLHRIKHERRYASDANPALIALYTALQSGWVPPRDVSEQEYAAARLLPDSDPLKAFVGFGCSFAGKWFGGYARGGRQNYAISARESLARKLQGLSGVEFSAGDYSAVRVPRAALVYCDPPYAGTTGYSGAPDAWNPALFWQWVRDISREAIVLVSEYTAPEDFTCVCGRCKQERVFALVMAT